MWTPSTGPSFSRTSFTKPAVLRIWLFPFPARSYWNVSTLSSPSRSVACAWVSPTEAISGSEYVTRGMPVSSMAGGLRPASSSARKMPCWNPR